jgi:hypothetical protein
VTIIPEICFYYKKEKKGEIVDYLPMVEFPPMLLIFPLIIVPLPVMLLVLVLSIVAFWVTSLLDEDFDSEDFFSDPDFGWDWDWDSDPDFEVFEVFSLEKVCSVQTTLGLPFGATHVPSG